MRLTAQLLRNNLSVLNAKENRPREWAPGRLVLTYMHLNGVRQYGIGKVFETDDGGWQVDTIVDGLTNREAYYWIEGRISASIEHIV